MKEQIGSIIKQDLPLTEEDVVQDIVNHLTSRAVRVQKVSMLHLVKEEHLSNFDLGDVGIASLLEAFKQASKSKSHDKLNINVIFKTLLQAM